MGASAGPEVARSAPTAPLGLLKSPQGQGFEFADEAVEVAGIVEPRLVIGLLVLADLAGHGLAGHCPGPGEVGPV